MAEEIHAVERFVRSRSHAGQRHASQAQVTRDGKSESIGLASAVDMHRIDLLSIKAICRAGAFSDVVATPSVVCVRLTGHPCQGDGEAIFRGCFQLRLGGVSWPGSQT